MMNTYECVKCKIIFGVDMLFDHCDLLFCPCCGSPYRVKHHGTGVILIAKEQLKKRGI